MKAQGGTEYLVLMSVVLGIALICVALLVWPVETTKDAKKSQTGVKFKIAAMEYPDLLQGLVAYWKFDEGSGTSAADSRGGYTGTLVNSPTWATGKNGYALSFDGTNYVNCGESGLILGANPHTYTAWINKPSFVGLNYIVATGNSVIGQQSGFGTSTLIQLFVSAYSSPIIYPASPALGTNTWRHLAMVYDGTNANFYVNGTYITSESIVLNTTVGKCRMGANVGNTPNFNGTIDEVMVFNRALSAGEIRLLYENPGYPQ